MSLSADFLATEARLITRVRALLPAWPARAVMGAADMAGVQDLGQFAPAVFVVYAGTQLEQGQSGGVLLWGAGALRQLLQQWRVVLQLRNAQGAALGDGLRLGALGHVELRVGRGMERHG